MNPNDWIKTEDRSRQWLMRRVFAALGRPPKSSTFMRYLDGTAFPPDDTIAATKKVTKGEVTRTDWEGIAEARGRKPNADGAYRNRYPTRRTPEPKTKGRK